MTAARASQLVAEILGIGAPFARASQIVVESLVVATPHARASQIVVESLVVATPHARASQIVLEPLVAATPRVRASQIVLEVLCLIVETGMLPVYPELPGLGFSVKWMPNFANMPTDTTATLADIDLGLANAPIHTFELTYDFLRDNALQNKGSSEFKTHMGFFLRLGGTRGRFLFRFKDDCRTTNEFIATTDGATNTWTLNRSFGVGENVGVEPVGYIDLNQPVNIYLDGLKVDKSKYQIVQTLPVNQQIQFFNTPAAGHTITGDYSYFYYCKFNDNTNTWEKFLDKIWLLNKIDIKSCRPGT
jgi:hypothetical protein